MEEAPNYNRALRELYALAERGVQPGLERVEQARDALGPMRIETVHVAGTNGKGSVCRMIAGGIDAKVGLFTSPHLHHLRERFQIFGAEPLSDEDIARVYFAHRALFAELTFFEAVAVLAFALFRDAGVDVAVIETGLGGRLDATTALVSGPSGLNACSAITRVARDHEAFLGSELGAIAKEKAGILMPGVPCVVGAQEPTARAAIELVAEEVCVPLLEPIDASEFQLGLAGAHQKENASVARAVLEQLAERGIRVDVRRGLEDARWPGRLERIDRAEQPTLLDAAHNPSGARALAAYLRTATGLPRPRVLLFAAMRDKRWREMLDVLAPEVDEIVCSSAALPRSAPASELAAHLGSRVGGYHEARAGAGSVVVAGSVFLVAHVRAQLLDIEPDPAIAM